MDDRTIEIEYNSDESGIYISASNTTSTIYSLTSVPSVPTSAVSLKVMPFTVTYQEVLDALGIEKLVEQTKEQGASIEEPFVFASQFGEMVCGVRAVESADAYNKEISIESRDQKWGLYLAFDNDVLAYLFISNRISETE